MPHVAIKHFPAEVTEEQYNKMVEALTTVICDTFSCEKGAVSIAIQPVEPNEWMDEVYDAEIIPNEQWLHKKPTYGTLAE